MTLPRGAKREGLTLEGLEVHLSLTRTSAPHEHAASHGDPERLKRRTAKIVADIPLRGDATEAQAKGLLGGRPPARPTGRCGTPRNSWNESTCTGPGARP
ncbi:MAG TPA: hypothetical protein VIG69_06985 [Candidatus Methylomirabilis sp.]|jgi:hypothetical protein